MSLTVQPIPKPTSHLADDLLLYKANYTFYDPSLTQDAVSCFSMSCTPDRARASTRSCWPDITVVWDALPRSFVTPSTPTISMPSMQMAFSPSPLPVSQVPSLVFPEISPPSQGSGSTPFERQFVGESVREWNNMNTQISPVVRRSFHTSFSLSPARSNVGGTPFWTDYGPTSQDSQDAIERVSLIDRFKSAAADEFRTTDTDIPFSVFPSQDPPSPLSDLSDLTSVSSDDYERDFDLRSSSPPTSPTTERPSDSRQSIIRCSDKSPDPEREPFSTHSTRNPSCSRDSDYQPAKGTTGRKRKISSQSRDGDRKPMGRKKARFTGSPEPFSTDASSSLGNLTRRILPTNVPYHPQFSLLYLRFPVSSHLRLADGKFPLLSGDSKRPAGIYNEPRDALDLYTPRFVKGCGATKVGICPICIENPSRGGKGEALWFSMKFSAYKVVFHFSLLKILARNASSYHLQYAHGISSVSGRPFSPPVAFRTVARQNPAKGERSSTQQGKCHKCKKWILVESIKNIDIKVKELYWWKHAAACHQGTRMDGDDDFFLDDEIYRRVRQEI